MLYFTDAYNGKANGAMAANMFEQGYDFCAISNDIDFMLASAESQVNAARAGVAGGVVDSGGSSGGVDSGGGRKEESVNSSTNDGNGASTNTSSASTNNNSTMANTSTSNITFEDDSDIYTSPFVPAGSAGAMSSANELVELRNQLAQEREKYNHTVQTGASSIPQAPETKASSTSAAPLSAEASAAAAASAADATGLSDDGTVWVWADGATSATTTKVSTPPPPPSAAETAAALNAAAADAATAEQQQQQQQQHQHQQHQQQQQQQQHSKEEGEGKPDWVEEYESFVEKNSFGGMQDNLSAAAIGGEEGWKEATKDWASALDDFDNELANLYNASAPSKGSQATAGTGMPTSGVAPRRF